MFDANWLMVRLGTALRRRLNNASPMFVSPPPITTISGSSRLIQLPSQADNASIRSSSSSTRQRAWIATEVRKCFPRRDRFDTARDAAATSPAAVVNRYVSAFSGGAVLSVVNPAVEYDARSDARTDRHIEHAGKTARRAVVGLSKACGIGVVFNSTR